MKKQWFKNVLSTRGLFRAGLALAVGVLFTSQAMAWDTNECGKLTGGGWILTPSGAKATFAVSGGIKHDAFWGHLEYIDHGTGLRVESQDVTSYNVDTNDDACADITFNVTINGTPGQAYVVACDNDDTGNGESEQGPKDSFSIVLSNGYMASGTLGDSQPGGGTIQIHKCPPGWQ